MAKLEPESTGHFPYHDTVAASMLSAGIRHANDARSRSLRSLAAELGYKQATVLSHMSKGRVPVPLDRAAKIAEVVGLPAAEFFRAVVAQRAPDALRLLSSATDGLEHEEGAHSLVAQLKELSGAPLEQLNEEQKRILREVVLDQHPAKRWLSPSEITVMALLRELRPKIVQNGLTRSELVEIGKVLYKKP
jgi:hypothetical protein